jgi:hypothetical protein
VVEEVKTDLARVEETLRKLDEKARLVVDKIGRDRFGWQPLLLGRVLVLPDTDRARRQVRTNSAVFDPALPARGGAVRAWLRDPEGPMAGILFVADIAPDGTNAARPGAQRVRVRVRRASRRDQRGGLIHATTAAVESLSTRFSTAWADLRDR